MSVVLFTRKDTIDGAMCGVIAKYVFGEDVEIVGSVPNEIDDCFINYFNIDSYYDTDEEKEIYNVFGNDKLFFYKNIFLTDLFLHEDLLYRIGRNSVVNKKFAICDNSKEAVKNGAGHYLFNNVKFKDGFDRLLSSTALFYEDLQKRKLINKSIMLDSVSTLLSSMEQDELTGDAKDLEVLYSALGKQKFCEFMMKKIQEDSNEKFKFSKEEKALIENYKNKQESNSEPNE